MIMFLVDGSVGERSVDFEWITHNTSHNEWLSMIAGIYEEATKGAIASFKSQKAGQDPQTK